MDSPFAGSPRRRKILGYAPLPQLYRNFSAILPCDSDRMPAFPGGVGLQVLGAIALYVIGRWLISFSVGFLHRALTKQRIEPTLMRFIGNTIAAILDITLVIAILGNFGVQTTSFAA